MTADDIISILSLFSGFTGPDQGMLWWRTEDKYAPITFLVNCNDLFVWGCADAEKITPADVPAFKQAIADSKGDKGDSWNAHLLWVARRREQRPQVAYYKYFDPHEVALFDACGPAETQYGREPAAQEGQPG